MARSKGKPAKGHMAGHSTKKVRGPRKTVKGGRKPSDTNPVGKHSNLYGSKKKS